MRAGPTPRPGGEAPTLTTGKGGRVVDKYPQTDRQIDRVGERGQGKCGKRGGQRSKAGEAERCPRGETRLEMHTET